MIYDDQRSQQRINRLKRDLADAEAALEQLSDNAERIINELADLEARLERLSFNAERERLSNRMEQAVQSTSICTSPANKAEDTFSDFYKGQRVKITWDKVFSWSKPMTQWKKTKYDGAIGVVTKETKHYVWVQVADTELKKRKHNVCVVM